MYTAQVLEKITKNGLTISATIFKGEEKLAKTSMPYDFSAISKDDKHNMSFKEVILKALASTTIKKRVGARLSTKGQITTYELV